MLAQILLSPLKSLVIFVAVEGIDAASNSPQRRGDAAANDQGDDHDHHEDQQTYNPAQSRLQEKNLIDIIYINTRTQDPAPGLEAHNE